MPSILCATDLSQESDIALREAAAQAQKDGAALTVTFVLLHPAALATSSLGPAAAAYTNLPELQSRAIAAVGQRVREVTGLTPERFQIRIDHGRPGVRIV
jgi:hypothetical protein